VHIQRYICDTQGLPTVCNCGSAEGLFVETVARHIKCYISVAWYVSIYILLMHAQNLRYQFPVIYDETSETLGIQKERANILILHLSVKDSATTAMMFLVKM
jgi:hypothetical protein